ncbi:DUF4180 domain-containing protein [Spirosoma sp. KNUC1025]|uniref:DUF4180 domain-containing protein n=1 Tax=Spirosoma sp. KNUC1025 TaxID=2894082 RepID=UPI00386BB451|nr:DUF4180 domain-containing protein [Spirosoma sp. KNUC1025]
MSFEINQRNGSKIAEILSETIVIATVEDGVDLVGNLYYQDIDKVIIHQKNIVSDFFDLKTGMAGEILQKFSNYRIQLAIVGDFSEYQSKSLMDFIRESNKVGQVNFVKSSADAIDKLSKPG